MHPPSRARRIFKWTGVVVFLLLLVLRSISLRYDLQLVVSPGIALVAERGGISGGVANFRIVSNPTGAYWRGWRGWGFEMPEGGFREIHNNGTGVCSWVWVPSWLLLLLTAIPTAWLWHRDRRLISSSPDHRLCLRCGYDLTGNTSGVCPECGDKACPPAGLADSEAQVNVGVANRR